MINSAEKARLPVAAGVINAVFALTFLVATGFAVYLTIVFTLSINDAGFESNLVVFIFGYLISGVVIILLIGLIGGCLITFFIYTAISVTTLISAKKSNRKLIKVFQIISVAVSSIILANYLWYAFVGLWHIGEPLARGDAITFIVTTPIAAMAAVNIIMGAILIAKNKKAVQPAV